jgi:hypothetical protein
MMLTSSRSIAAMKMMILVLTCLVSDSAQPRAKVCCFLKPHLESY